MYAANQSVAKMRDAHLFHLTRARLQRCSDMKFFSGWLLDIKVDTASIRLNGDISEVKSGDLFSVEVTGKEKTAVFIGEVIAVIDDTVTLQLPRGVATLPKKETARISLFGYQGRLQVEGAETPFTLVDISEEGMGIITATEVPQGTIVEFEVTTPQGILNGKGEIRYCRPDPDAPERLRVGLKIEHLDRIERARWLQLMTSVWES